MVDKRLNNYDLLRVCATYAVVLLHVTGLWIVSSGSIKTQIIITLAYIFNDLSRFAVPCFLMLSGALLMKDERKISFKQFYKKAFFKLGIPTLVCSLLYTVYMLFAFNYGVYKLNGNMSAVLLTRFLRGVPMFHLWFMYMLVWIYIFAPFVKIVKANISTSTYTKMGTIFCLMATISATASTGRYVSWDIGRAFEFLSYFIIGDIICMNTLLKNNFKGFLFILAGVFTELFAGISSAYKLNSFLKLGTAVLPSAPISPLTPLATVASVLFFIGFSKLKVEGHQFIRKLSDNSFNIFLIHALFIDLFIRIPIFKMGMQNILNNTNVAICLPMVAVIVYFISYLSGLLCNNICSFFLLTSISIKFYGSNNLIYLGPDVMFRNTKINFKGDNSIVFLNSSKHEYKINIDLQYNIFFYVGNNNYFNGMLNIILSEEKNVFIGDGGLFSSGIWIRVAAPHLIYEIPSCTRINHSKSVFIGDHVWVGQDVFILKGSKIGSGSIIAAKSSIPGLRVESNSIWGGSPAKRIKTNVFWEGDCVHSWRKEQTKKFEKCNTGKNIYGFDRANIDFDELEASILKYTSVKERFEALKSITKEKNRFFIAPASVFSNFKKFFR